MQLNEWALQWAIPVAALDDLRRRMGAVSTEPNEKAFGLSETAVQTNIRLEASRCGMRLWRNNVGGTYTQEGSFLRYGLCNDTKAMNKLIKSSDLIGLRPVLIEPHHVGHVIGQFVAREVKEQAWRFGGTERENAQLAFLKLVLSMGGDAAFANNVGTL